MPRIEDLNHQTDPFIMIVADSTLDQINDLILSHEKLLQIQSSNPNVLNTELALLRYRKITLENLYSKVPGEYEDSINIRVVELTKLEAERDSGHDDPFKKLRRHGLRIELATLQETRSYWEGFQRRINTNTPNQVTSSIQDREKQLETIEPKHPDYKKVTAELKILKQRKTTLNRLAQIPDLKSIEYSENFLKDKLSELKGDDLTTQELRQDLLIELDILEARKEILKAEQEPLAPEQPPKPELPHQPDQVTIENMDILIQIFSLKQYRSMPGSRNYYLSLRRKSNNNPYIISFASAEDAKEFVTRLATPKGSEYTKVFFATKSGDLVTVWKVSYDYSRRPNKIPNAKGVLVINPKELSCRRLFIFNLNTKQQVPFVVDIYTFNSKLAKELMKGPDFQTLYFLEQKVPPQN